MKKACCANCKHKPNCGYPSDNSYCEEYEGKGITPQEIISQLKTRIAEVKVQVSRLIFTREEVDTILKSINFAIADCHYLGGIDVSKIKRLNAIRKKCLTLLKLK